MKKVRKFSHLIIAKITKYHKAFYEFIGPYAQRNQMVMSKMKQLDDIAEGIADVTMELMYDSIDWQLADFQSRRRRI